MNTFMLDRKWLFSGVMMVVAFAGLMAMPQSAFAAINITDIDVNGVNAVTVEPSESITISVTTSLTSGDGWRSTEYRFESGGYTCVDTPDNTTNGSHTETFIVSAPASAGTYDLDIQARENAGCTGTQDSDSLNNGVEVAYRYTDSATLDGGGSVTVLPGASITAVVTGTISGGSTSGDWDGTQWLISTTPPGEMSCENTPDNNSDGTFTESFSITAPVAPGTYNAYFRVTGRDNCNDQLGTLLTMEDAVIVIPPVGTITVYKDVEGPDGEDVSDSHVFTVRLNGDDASLVSETGEVLFEDLSPGTHTITEDPDAAYDFYSFSTDNDPEAAGAQITVVAGENMNLTIINRQQPGSITIVKVADPADEGEFDFDLTGPTSASFLVTGSGQVTFNNLLPGAYSLSETVPEGWDGEYPNPPECTGEGNSPEDITLGSGGSVTCIFNNTQLGSISGMKWEDEDADGVRDEGEGSPDESFTIFIDTNEDGELDEEEYDYTDEGGAYSFTNLLPGTYRICEVEEEGWYRSYPTDSNCQDVIVVSNSPDKDVMDVNFGNYQNGSIRGYKFLDYDGDGYWDDSENEYGLSEWTIYVDENDNNVLDEGERYTMTDEDGRYLFEALRPGVHIVREVLQEGWEQTYPSGGQEVIVTSGNLECNINFGNFEGNTIIVYKWNDFDENGEWLQPNGHENEPGIANWTVYLTGTARNGDPINRSAQTDEGGRVSFFDVFTTLETEGRLPYQVSEEQRDGWTRTSSQESFNVYVNYSGQTHDDDGEISLWFGNHENPVVQEEEPAAPAGNGPIVGPGGIGVPGAGGFGGSGGQVLGASVGPEGEEEGGEVLGASTCDLPMLQTLLGAGLPNDPGQVMLLQSFLNGEMGSGLPVTGFFGTLTTGAVSQFQLKYWQEVLAPWVPFGLPTDHTTTGFVGKLTQWKINSLICPALNLPVPQIP